MAALTPIATVLTVAAQGLQAAHDVAGTALRTAHGHAAYRQQARELDAQVEHVDLRQQQDQAEAAEQRARTERETEREQRRRRDALRRAVSRQRASLGARGLVAPEGSGEALLLGLVDESAADGAALDQERQARLATIDRDAEYRRRLNLIERSRLAGRRRLHTLSGLTERL